MHRENIIKAGINAFERVSLYSGILKQGPGPTAYDLLCSLEGPGAVKKIKTLSARLFEELAACAESRPGPQVGSLWQNHLLEGIVCADNTFTRMASADLLSSGGAPAWVVKAAAAEDLAMLKIILDLDFARLLPESQGKCLHLDLACHTPDGGTAPPPAAHTPEAGIYDMKQALLSAREWGQAADWLTVFHRRCGCGIFCRHHALLWDGAAKSLAGIADPDPVRLEDLVGYENERARVVEITERLLDGLPSGNVLLYGERGTGKSSTVKGLLGRYGSRGLRLVELPRLYLNDYPLVLSALRGPRLKFIIYVDDLSFEDHETEYKHLKSMLDGSLRSNPTNSVIYATSNRRHLVREYFSERRQEVGGTDTLQEKLSLSDRFGTTVLFLTPDQDLYLKIVEGLARQRGIDLPAAQIRLQALEWERWHNSRSGRTARQFIDQLIK